MKRDFFGWKCAIGCFIISFCHSGIFYALPTLYPYFLDKLGASMTVLSVSATISTVSGTLAAFIAAPLLDKLGARKMFFFGTFAAVSFLLLMAFAGKLYIIWIAMAMSGITMSFGLRAACVAVINAWFVALAGFEIQRFRALFTTFTPAIPEHLLSSCFPELHSPHRVWVGVWVRSEHYTNSAL